VTSLGSFLFSSCLILRLLALRCHLFKQSRSFFLQNSFDHLAEPFLALFLLFICLFLDLIIRINFIHLFLLELSIWSRVWVIRITEFLINQSFGFWFWFLYWFYFKFKITSVRSSPFIGSKEIFIIRDSNLVALIICVSNLDWILFHSLHELLFFATEVCFNHSFKDLERLGSVS